jgi:hypothetical protein
MSGFKTALTWSKVIRTTGVPVRVAATIVVGGGIDELSGSGVTVDMVI